LENEEGDLEKVKRFENSWQSQKMVLYYKYRLTHRSDNGY
jgi:hypothetical protein